MKEIFTLFNDIEMNTIEIFVPIAIPEYSKSYKISTLGNIRSEKTKNIMKPYPRNGYLSVGLYSNSKRKNYKIHRLVAITFLTNPNNLEVVNHKDGNKINNCLENLEWVTLSENAQHSATVLGKTKKTTPVKQLDLNGNCIAIYCSVKDAAYYSGASTKKIPSVCTGIEKTAGGYKWEYVHDVRTIAPEGRILSSHPDYTVTRFGTVYSTKSSKFLILKQKGDGYIGVQLYNVARKDFYVHVLVATLYLDNVAGKTQVNHKDRNKTNNNVENLEWVTASENMVHAIETGVNNHTRPVIMCNINDNEIKRFNSIIDASIETGINRSGIGLVCRGKQKTAGNYKWKYG